MDRAVPRLRRSDCSAPGIARRRRGRGFEYLDPAGERVADPEGLERIGRAGVPGARRGGGFDYLDPPAERVEEPERLERIGRLAIPPAWPEVWICMDSRGHLQ